MGLIPEVPARVEMNQVIRFTISGHAPDTDAPSVEDLLDQIRDYVELLQGVEEATSGDPQSAIIWRVVEASRNSPVSFGIAPYPRQFATNIDHRVSIVVSETSRGLVTIKNQAQRPTYFNDALLRKARKIAERVTNGIGNATVDFGRGLPVIEFTPSVARITVQNVDFVLEKHSKPYQEVGSVEGYLEGIAVDGHNRRIAHIWDRVTGETVKCVIPHNAQQVILDIASRQIGDVWERIRIHVMGRIFYKGPGEIDHIDVEDVRFFRLRADLPQIDDIIDENFTGGLRSEDYLERLRNGTLAW